MREKELLSLFPQSPCIASLDTGGIDLPKKFTTKARIRKLSVHNITHEEADEILAKIANEFDTIVGVKGRLL